MAEYIKREDAYITLTDYYHHSTKIQHMALKEALDRVPTAEVRPVVLCKDCKYFSEVMYKGTQFEYGYCDRWAGGTLMDPEDFCSRAAKKEES